MTTNIEADPFTYLCDWNGVPLDPHTMEPFVKNEQAPEVKEPEYKKVTFYLRDGTLRHKYLRKPFIIH